MARGNQTKQQHSMFLEAMCNFIRSNDKYLTGVLASDEHVVHYVYNESSRIWICDGIEGICLLLERSLSPFHVLMFLAVREKDPLREKPYVVKRVLTGACSCERDGPYVYIRSPDQGSSSDTFKFKSWKVAMQYQETLTKLIGWHQERSSHKNGLLERRRHFEAGGGGSSTTASSDEEPLPAARSGSAAAAVNDKMVGELLRLSMRAV